MDMQNINKKIAIIGCSGSGKSTLATKLGDVLKLNVVHLDAHFWHPGWVPTPEDKWIEITEKLMAQESWIMDGNFSGTMDMRLKVADTIIFMDFPRTICLWRIIKRRFQNFGKSRPDVGPGCPERFLGAAFFELLNGIWNYPKKQQPVILEKLRAYAEGRHIITLSSPADVTRFLEDARRSGVLDAWYQNAM
jgi:adenylate kinase family enzyme